MIPWKQAYDRLTSNEVFQRQFGQGGRAPRMSSFRTVVYSSNTSFFNIAASASPGAAFGVVLGPLLQNFPAGAVILGITASAYQAQVGAAANFQYAPSMNPGRRDLFALNFSYTGGDQITPNGLTMADALLGSGEDTIFPAKELLVPPSQSLNVSVASIAPAPILAVTIAYHCAIPAYT